MTEWQDISTVPRNGTRIMLYRNGHYVFGNWDDDRHAAKPRPYWSHDSERIFGTVDARKNPPTHWRPLPPAPRSE